MKTTVAQNVHALIGKTPRVHSTCEIEEVEEEEVQEDSVLREEYRIFRTHLAGFKCFNVCARG